MPREDVEAMEKKRKSLFIIGIIVIAVLLAAVVFLSIKLGILTQKTAGPYDLSISTKAGFTQDKVDEIRGLDGVVALVGVYEEITDTRVIQSFPENVITPKMVEGRQIELGNEVVVDSRYAQQKNLHLGQKIPLTVGGSASLYTIVGLAEPSFDMQSPAKPFFYVDISAFHTDGYNRIYLCVSRNTSLNSVQKEIHALGSVGQKNRYEQLRKGVQSKANETEQLMDTVLGPVKEELDAAKEKLNAAQQQLDLSGNTAKITEAEAQLQAAKEELDKNRKALDETKESLTATQTTLTERREQLQEKKEAFQISVEKADVSADEIDSRLVQLYEELAAAPGDKTILRSIEALESLQETRSALETEQEELDRESVEFLRAMQTYQFSEYAYKALQADYNKKAEEFEKQKSAFEQGKDVFSAKQEEYRQAEKEYLEKKRAYDEKLEAYQKEIDAIEPADWVITHFGQDGTILRLENAVF